MARQESEAGTYPVIRRDVSGPTALVAPSFPLRCPACGAERTFIQIEQPAASSRCNYACGGGYYPINNSANPRSLDHQHNRWSGKCGR